MTVGEERIKKKDEALQDALCMHYSTVAFSLPLSLFLGIGDPSIGVYEAILCFPKRNLQRIKSVMTLLPIDDWIPLGKEESRLPMPFPRGQAYRTALFVLRYRYPS